MHSPWSSTSERVVSFAACPPSPAPYCPPTPSTPSHHDIAFFTAPRAPFQPFFRHDRTSAANNLRLRNSISPLARTHRCFKPMSHLTYHRLLHSMLCSPATEQSPPRSSLKHPGIRSLLNSQPPPGPFAFLNPRCGVEPLSDVYGLANIYLQALR